VESRFMSIPYFQVLKLCFLIEGKTLRRISMKKNTFFSGTSVLIVVFTLVLTECNNPTNTTPSVTPTTPTTPAVYFSPGGFFRIFE